MASSVALSDSTTSAGTTAYGTSTGLATPGSYSYSDTFLAGTGGKAVSANNPDGFYDDFVFTIAGATADSVTSTINLGNTLEIDGLQVALFSYSQGQSVPVAGSPLAAGWSSSFNSGPASGTISVIPNTILAAGSYVLEVEGTVTGSSGGTYSGSLNLAPVPLPAGLPLLLSGVAGLAFWSRRRRS